MKKKRIRRVILLVVAATLLFGFYYVNDYYSALEKEIEEFEIENTIKVETLENNTIVCIPKETTTGLIFYPGGKVEHMAYLPLMKACASEGIMCVLVEMPLKLAVLDMNAADGIQEKYPEIENWYMAGHSLGGTMAASYIKENAEDYEGLILLGAYTTSDLKNADLKVLSIYGSEDQVMNKEKYIENKTNLPHDLKEIIIEGGNHAGFGMYGEQEGDGVSALSNEEQIIETSKLISGFVNE